MPLLIVQPDGVFRLGDFLTSGLQDLKWTHFRAAVAFVKQSGTRYIEGSLERFSRRGLVCITVGIDHGGSSVEALQGLVSAVGTRGQLWVYKNGANTFHPKVYLFKNATQADVVVGSGNLTKGGLYENSEAGVRISLDLRQSEDVVYLKSVEEMLNVWNTANSAVCLPLDAALISILHGAGILPTEAEAAAAIRKSMALAAGADRALKESPFKSKPIRHAPLLASTTSPTTKRPLSADITGTQVKAGEPSSAVSATGHLVVETPNKTEGLTFGMTLQNTDVGVGMTSSGTTARSPEVFIPIAALDMQPTFWGWQTSFVPDPHKYREDMAWRAKNSAWISSERAKANRKPRPLDKLDWTNVQIRLIGHAGMLTTTLWFNPKKKDLRIRESSLRSSGSIGDIFLVRQASQGAIHRYEVEVIPASHPQYAAYLAKLTTSIRNSQKKIGYF